MLSILKSGEDIPTPGNLKLDIADTSLVEKHGLTRSEIVAEFPQRPFFGRTDLPQVPWDRKLYIACPQKIF